MDSTAITEFILALVFYGLIGATLGGAIIAIQSRRIIRSVSGLALSSIGSAGLYYFLNSPFVALMEILIYVGAVCITIIFAIMLAEPQEPATKEKTYVPSIAGFVIGFGAFAGLTWLALTTSWNVPETRISDGSVEAIGNALLTTYSLVFELISLVLLVAILGALVIARTGRNAAV